VRPGIFDGAAEQYDAARPAYPAGTYDLVESVTGPLAGRVVGDGGAGTGVVSRQLLERDARVVAFDTGPGMLRRATLRSPGLRAVVADAAALPFATASMDLLCFGQSWHWVDQLAGAREAGRVLRPGGWWTAWWNQARPDGEACFEGYLDALETRCDGYSRAQRDIDWCAETFRHDGHFDQPDRHVVPWVRRVSVGHWLTDLESHSYVIAMGGAERDALLSECEAILRGHFGDQMVVPYETVVWMARRG